MSTIIWHDKYKDKWECAFPLGNGRIAAMVYGNPSVEQIQINEESLWSGKQIEEEYKPSKEVLAQIRSLLLAEEYEKAAELCRNTYLTDPPFVRFYESFGDIFIDFKNDSEYRDYRKELELRDAVVRVAWTKAETQYKSEAFISEAYDALVYRVCTNGLPFSCDVTIKRGQDAYTSSLDDHTLLMNGQLVFQEEKKYGAGGEGMSFGARIYVDSDGKVTASKSSISVKNATFVTVFGAFATNYNVELFDIDESIPYKKKLQETIEKVKAADYEKIKQEHIRSHKKQFEKVFFELDAPDNSLLPTDERIERLCREQGSDLDLEVLYYNFDRYLLLESSGKNAVLPANLQGKWCNKFRPEWGSDYHSNINLQMNYWPAGPSNLLETMKPFVHFIKMIRTFGQVTAKKLFDANGWVINHTTDVFGRTGVHDSVDCGFFPMAGPWLCLNLWEYYEYTNSVDVLKEIYSILKESCQFVREYLTEGENGMLVTAPSNSPENWFFYTDKNGEKKRSMITYGATMDNEIIYALFTRTIYACEKLCCDKELADVLQQILKRLPPLRISQRYGTICEWIQDYEETEPGHRHISHLFGLYPGDQINETDENIFKAAERTIERRISHGSGGMFGWTNAWGMNFYARLKNGEKALELYRVILKELTYENMFDKALIEPPVFQIDGNLGAAAGVTELLLQSHLGNPDQRILEILPALPKSWKSGRICGIRARGNFECDIQWQDHKPVKLAVTSHDANVLRIKINEPMRNFKTDKEYTLEDSVLKMKLDKQETVIFNF